jgi:hypothetical protein
MTAFRIERHAATATVDLRVKQRALSMLARQVGLV